MKGLASSEVEVRRHKCSQSGGDVTPTKRLGYEQYVALALQNFTIGGNKKMKKTFFPAAVALCCASLAFAQDAAQRSQDQSSSKPTSGTVQGCLSGSQGGYMLTDDSTGTMIKLIGSDDKLKAHVGHEVLITGQLVNSGSASSGSEEQQGNRSSDSDASGGARAIQVSDVSMLSKHCSAADK